MMNNKKQNKKQLKTRNREPQGRLASVSLNETSTKTGYRAGVIEAVRTYVKGRRSGRGRHTHKRRKCTRPLPKNESPHTPARLAGIIYNYINKFVSGSKSQRSLTYAGH